MEEVRRNDEVTRDGETVGDVTNMVIDPKGLMQHDKRTRRFRRAGDVDRKTRGVRRRTHAKFGSSVLERLSS